MRKTDNYSLENLDMIDLELAIQQTTKENCMFFAPQCANSNS